MQRYGCERLALNWLFTSLGSRVTRWGQYVLLATKDPPKNGARKFPMFRLRARHLVFGLVFFANVIRAAPLKEVLIADAQSEPESLSVGPDGTLFAGSASSPFIYRVRSGSPQADIFFDASRDGAGTFFFGILADANTNTLWACELTPNPEVAPVKPHSTLRGFDLTTGAQKFHWTFPGVNSVCNDFTVGPDQALYVTDTLNGRIYKLASGTVTPKLLLENGNMLKGIDGITFLNGKLYVTNVFTDKLYRIAFCAGCGERQIVEITTDQPLKASDGMRAGGGMLLLADSGHGRVVALILHGDNAHVHVIRDGLQNPTAVELSGKALWIAERGSGKAVSVPMPTN